MTIFCNEVIDESDKINTKNHELLHTASSKFLSPKYFTGFKKCVNGIEIALLKQKKVTISDYILSLREIEYRDNLDLSQTEEIEFLSYGPQAKYRIIRKTSDDYKKDTSKEIVLVTSTESQTDSTKESRFLLYEKKKVLKLCMIQIIQNYQRCLK